MLKLESSKLPSGRIQNVKRCTTIIAKRSRNSVSESWSSYTRTDNRSGDAPAVFPLAVSESCRTRRRELRRFDSFCQELYALSLVQSLLTLHLSLYGVLACVDYNSPFHFDKFANRYKYLFTNAENCGSTKLIYHTELKAQIEEYEEHFHRNSCSVCTHTSLSRISSNLSRAPSFRHSFNIGNRKIMADESETLLLTEIGNLSVLHAAHHT